MVGADPLLAAATQVWLYYVRHTGEGAALTRALTRALTTALAVAFGETPGCGRGGVQRRT